MTLKQTIREFFLDYINNYLTIEQFAEDNGISITDAKTIIRLGKKYHDKLCRQEYFESRGIKKAGA